MVALAPFERMLHNAHFSHFARCTSRDAFNIVADIYHKRVSNRQRMDYSCGACVRNVLGTIGRLYFEQKGRIEENAQPKAKNARKRTKTRK